MAEVQLGLSSVDLFPDPAQPIDIELEISGTLCNYPLFEFGIDIGDLIPSIPDFSALITIPLPDLDFLPLACPLDAPPVKSPASPSLPVAP